MTDGDTMMRHTLRVTKSRVTGDWMAELWCDRGKTAFGDFEARGPLSDYTEWLPAGSFVNLVSLQVWDLEMFTELKAWCAEQGVEFTCPAGA